MQLPVPPKLVGTCLSALFQPLSGKLLGSKELLTFRSEAHSAEGEAAAGRMTHVGSRKKTNGLEDVVVMG